MTQCIMLVVRTAALLVAYVDALQLSGSASLPTQADDDKPCSTCTEDANPDLMSVFDNYYPPRGDITNPRMLVMRGCSGSSAIMLFARTLLRMHGIPVPSAWESKFDENGNGLPPLELKGTQAWPAELLKPKINWFYKEAGEDMGEAMRMANDKIHTYNQTLFFKGMAQEIANKELWAKLKGPFVDMKVLAVFSARANMLDQVICQIKDCFHDEYGIPVDPATGKQSDLCLDRRDDTLVHSQSESEQLLARRTKLHLGSMSGFDGDYKANVQIGDLLKHLKREENFLQDAKDHMYWGGVPFKQVPEEDLLEFETDIPGAMERGTQAWGKLLRSFGVEPDYAVITNFLSKFANTYPSDPPHKDLIYNWQEVKEALHGTPYQKFWRGDDDV